MSSADNEHQKNEGFQLWIITSHQSMLVKLLILLNMKTPQQVLTTTP